MNAILLAIAIFTSVPPEQFNRFNEIAGKGDTQQLMALADSIIMSQPPKNQQNVLTSLVVTLVAKKRDQQALELIKRYRKKLKNPTLLANNMVIIYTHLEKLDSAIYELLTASNTNKTSISYLMARLKKYDLLLSPDRVDEVIKKWQKEHKKTKLGYQLLAARYYMRGQLETALKLVEKYHISSLWLAQSALNKGDYQLAMKLAQGDTSNQTVSNKIIGLSYLAASDTANALKYLKMAARKGDKSAKDVLIDLALKKGEKIIHDVPLSVDEMMPVWFCSGHCNVIEKLPMGRDSARYYFYKGLCRVFSDSSKDEAFETLDSVIKKSPASDYAESALRLRSYALFYDSVTFRRMLNVEKAMLCHRYSTALDSVNSILNKKDLDALSRDNLSILKGQLLSRVGRDSEAVQVFMKVTGPARPIALWNAFKTARKLGDVELTQQIYDELITKYSKSPFAQMVIGMM